MSKTICVFSSSSDAAAPRYFEAAGSLGRILAERGHTLMYGGAAIGLMGEVARSVHRHGGSVIGVIPHYLAQYEIAYHSADELIFTEDMRQRKAIMEDRSDAFLSLPGGFGTLEETLEIITLKQIQQHNKPIVLINTDNFYEHLIQLFQRMYSEFFARESASGLYEVAPDALNALDYIDSYQPREFEKKWF